MEPSCADIDYFDADIGAITIVGDTLTVDVENISIREVTTSGWRPVARARLIFPGVIKSVRKMYRYQNAPARGPFGRAELIADIDSNDARPGTRTFKLEGRLIDPPAWIDDWQIVAQSCKLEVDRPEASG